MAELQERLEELATAEETLETLAEQKMEALEGARELERQVEQLKELLGEADENREIFEETEELLKQELAEARRGAEAEARRTRELDADLRRAQQELADAGKELRGHGWWWQGGGMVVVAGKTGGAGEAEGGGVALGTPAVSNVAGLTGWTGRTVELLKARQQELETSSLDLEAQLAAVGATHSTLRDEARTAVAAQRRHQALEAQLQALQADAAICRIKVSGAAGRGRKEGEWARASGVKRVGKLE